MTGPDARDEPSDADEEAIRIVGGIHAVVAATVGKPGRQTSVSSRQHIVQRNGRTVITTTRRESTTDNSTSEEDQV